MTLKKPFFITFFSLIKTQFIERLWDFWCLFSIIGIWPRFIEPHLLAISKISLKIPSLATDLSHLKILQFSDLHMNSRVPDFFLNHLVRKVKELTPDLIVFTGDFLCYSQLENKKRLKDFLNSFTAPYGCYAILGNHDYARFVSVNAKGEYDIVESTTTTILRGFQRLFTNTTLQSRITSRAKEVGHHVGLLKLLEETPFKVLDNSTYLIPIKKAQLNLCGLGEYTLGQCKPEEAFKAYDRKCLGIILSHNPDSLSLLEKFPGELILSGHTHGGQVNLPWMWKKFTLLENPLLKRGLVHLNKKWIYINRGIGSVMPFRWFSLPEITLITLETSHEN